MRMNISWADPENYVSYFNILVINVFSLMAVQTFPKNRLDPSAQGVQSLLERGLYQIF